MLKNEENQVIAEDITTEVKRNNGNEKKPTAQQLKKQRTLRIAGTAIFAVISVLLYITKVPPFVFPIFPGPFSFLEMNFSEVPALIAGFAYGPLSSFLVLFIRLVVKLPMSTTGMVGEFADIIYSSSFVITASIIYKYRRTFKGVLLGLGIAFVVQLIVSGAANYFVVYYMYNEMLSPYGGLPFTPEEFIVAVIPFNIIKNTVIALITLLVYKRISKFIHSLFV